VRFFNQASENLDHKLFVEFSEGDDEKCEAYYPSLKNITSLGRRLKSLRISANLLGLSHKVKDYRHRF
jgi:hypothetical protein